jgi:hypothetical protein
LTAVDQTAGFFTGDRHIETRVTGVIGRT